MADTFPTLAELININDKRLNPRLVNNLRDDAPLVMSLPAQLSSNGTVHRWLARSTPLTVGFRAINAGIAKSPSVDTPVSATLEYLDGSFVADVAYAQSYQSPVYGNGPMAYVNRETESSIRASMFAFEKQILNGTAADAGGFDGLADSLDLTSNAMVISAGDNTADSVTSVYLLRVQEDDFYVVTPEGRVPGRGMWMVGEPNIVPVTGSNSETHNAYNVAAGAHLGLCIASTFSAARICNIATSGSSNLLDDDLLYQGVELFPAARRPNVLVMNPKTWEQLRSSRTATNIPGNPPPLPETVAGMRIVVTDALVNTEAVVAAS